jgi:hypothetical protein
MSTESESMMPFPAMASFNRYGLPGLVIGTQFVLIVGLIYVLVNVAIPALQASTRAMAEMTSAVTRLTETIRDRQ